MLRGKTNVKTWCDGGDVQLEFDGKTSLTSFIVEIDAKLFLIISR